MYCHVRNVDVYLALNIIIYDSELHEVFNISFNTWKVGFDGIIIQDIRLASVLYSKIKGIRLHTSTQMTSFDLNGCITLDSIGLKEWFQLVIYRSNKSKNFAVNAIQRWRSLFMVHSAYVTQVNVCYLQWSEGEAEIVVAVHNLAGSCT